MSKDDDDSWGSEGEDEEASAPRNQNRFKAQLQSNIKDAKDEPCVGCGAIVPFADQLRIEGQIYHKTVYSLFLYVSC